jgi:predicted nuclease of restriction endonuclease-like (RecB) superfamily
MNEIQLHSQKIVLGVIDIVEKARKKVSIQLNKETSLLYWEIGIFINQEILLNDRAAYGGKILVNVSQHLTLQLGKGYTYTALTRMCKIAKIFDNSIIATLSQQLSWSHLIELSGIEDDLKRYFFVQLCTTQNWGVRELREKIDSMMFERTAIASKPEETIKAELQKIGSSNNLSPDLVFKNTYVLDFLNLSHNHSENDLEKALVGNLQEFIQELGNGFAFLERQKRISIDTIDYHLDLLFYHRKLRRLIAIDLKIGKFKPQYKAQMELYLRWLKKYEMQEGEDTPIGLLLCSEGNTEHIELLMLDEKEIKVAQYLTELPSKEWFAEKLHRAIEIAKMNS